MQMPKRIRIERPDGGEIRFTRLAVRGEDVGTLQAAMWNPERSDWELQELSRDDVRFVRDFLSAWLGEDN